MKWLSLALLFLTSPMFGQSITGLQSEVEVGRKIVASIDMPTDGKLSILWAYSPGLESEQIAQKLFIWGKAGTYYIDAVVIPIRTVTIGEETFDVINGEIIRLKSTLKIINGPGPGPGPDPVVPFPAPGLAVVITHEQQTTAQLPRSQQTIFTSSRILQWLSQNCYKTQDNTTLFRIYDDDQDVTNVHPVLKNAFNAAREASSGRGPWIVISNGKIGFSGPLPLTIDQTLDLLKRYTK